MTKAPADLKAAGRGLWAQFAADQLRDAERALVLEACRTVDELARITAELAEGEAMVWGSMGQPVANPLLAEARTHRETLRRLLAEVGATTAARSKMPDKPVAKEGRGKLAILQDQAQRRKAG